MTLGALPTHLVTSVRGTLLDSLVFADTQGALSKLFMKVVTYGKLAAGAYCLYQIFHELGGEGGLVSKLRPCVPYIVALAAIAGATVVAPGDGGFADILAGWNW